MSDCKEIVVYGQNLSSGIGAERLLQKHVKYMYGIPKDKLSMIFGLLLTDAWLVCDTKNRSVNARLGIKQSMINFQFIWSVFNELSHYCNSLPYTSSSLKNGKIFYNVTVQTRALPVLTLLYNMFYLNNIKIVPVDIKDYLDEIALAYWIMGDGYKRNNGVALCTDSFTKLENQLLVEALDLNLGLKSTIFSHSSGQDRLHINVKQMPKLINLVKNHMHPTMLYKLGL